MAPSLQVVITGTGSIKATHAPIGETCPSRIKLQKISQQQMVIYRKAAHHSLSIHNFILQVKLKVVYRLQSCLLSVYIEI